MSDSDRRADAPYIAFHRVMIWFAYGAVALFFAILITALSGVFAVIYWINHGNLAEAVGNAVSTVSGVEVAMDSLEIKSGGDVKAKGLRIKTADGSRIWINGVDARFRLGSLFKGKIAIADLSLESPTISLAPPPSLPGQPLKPFSLLMPSISSPVPIEVEAFRMTDFLFETHSRAQSVVLSGIGVSSKGRVGPYGANMTTSIVTSEDSTFIWENAGRTLEMSPRLIATVSLQESGEIATVVDSDFLVTDAPGRFKAGAPPRLKTSIRANGEISGFPTGKASVSIWLDGEETVDASISLTEITSGLGYEFVAKKFHLPLQRISSTLAPEDIKINGYAEMAPFSMKGQILNSGAVAEASMSGEARLRLYYFSGFGATLPNGGTAEIKFDDFHISSGAYSGGFKGGVSIPKLAREGLAVTGVFAKLEGKAGGEKGASKGEITVSLFAAGVKDEGLAVDGVKVWTRAGGDFLKGDFPDVYLTMSAQEKISVKASGYFKNFGQSWLKVKADIAAPLDRMIAGRLLRQSHITITGGEISGLVYLEGALGNDFNAPKLAVSTDIGFSDISGSSKPAGLDVAMLSGSLNAKAAVNPLWEMTDVSATLAAIAEKVEIEKNSVVEYLNLEFKMAGPKVPNGLLDISLDGSAERFYSKEALEREGMPQLPLSFNVSAEMDTVAETVNLRNAFMRLGQSTLKGKGRYDISEAGFKGDVSAEAVDLKNIFELLPKKTRESFKTQNLGGVLAFTASGEGKIPKSWKNIERALPFDVALNISLKDGLFHSRSLGLDADGAVVNLKAEISKASLRLSGNAGAKWFKARDVFGETELDPSVSFDIESWKDKRIEARLLEFSAPKLGVSESLKGTVKGISLQNLGQAMENPKAFLSTVTLNLENRFSMELEKGAALALGAGLEGGMKVNLTVTSVPKQNISITGVTQFTNLTAKSDGKPLVERLSGRIPFAKTYWFEEPAESHSRDQADDTRRAAGQTGVRDTSFFESLRGAGARRDSVTAERVELGFMTLRDLIMDLTFKETRLSMDYMKMSLLDGGLTGSVYMKGEKEQYTLRLNGVFAGLNMNRLFEGGGIAKREAEVDGAMDVSLGLKKGLEAEDLDISKLDLSLTLSRIGTGSLEKILLFVDPKESSPAVMNVRSLLKYAAPEKVELVTRHGALSLTVDMKYNAALGGQSVSMPVMKRVPMNRLVNFGMIKEWTKKLSPLVVVLRHVGATVVMVDEKGKVTFK
ncbi:MAG: hypothetical protein HQK86_14015 [Nitrospinae bacterium]|nr:hypothetical protein [Nitrospinota bacterium]